MDENKIDEQAELPVAPVEETTPETPEVAPETPAE